MYFIKAKELYKHELLLIKESVRVGFTHPLIKTEIVTEEKESPDFMKPEITDLKK